VSNKNISENPFLTTRLCFRSRQLESIGQELLEAKLALVVKTEEMQHLGARGNASEEMFNQIQKTVLALTRERDELTAEISEFANERAGE
jgi:hypothetical protein